jgi:hypothetical protein
MVTMSSAKGAITPMICPKRGREELDLFRFEPRHVRPLEEASQFIIGQNAHIEVSDDRLQRCSPAELFVDSRHGDYETPLRLRAICPGVSDAKIRAHSAPAVAVRPAYG